MTTPALPHPPEIAAEFARIMAEQADLNRRAFRLMEALCTSTIAPSQTTAPGAPQSSITAQPDSPVSPSIEPTAREQALGDAIMVAGLRPEAVAAAAACSTLPSAIAAFEAGGCMRGEANASRPAAPRTKKDKVLDLYASSLLTTTQMSERLGIGQSTVSGTISLGRTAKDPRAIAGDDARREERARNWESRQSGVPTAEASPAPNNTAPTSSDDAIAPAALPKPASSALAKPNGQVRVSMKDRVLNHYADTGDHAPVIAQKLGLLRTDVNAFILNAGAARDERVIRGDCLRARRTGGRP